MKYLFHFFLLFLLVFSWSCKKKLNFSNKNLSFSNQEVLFDTIFTSLGSTTERLKIYNQNNLTVKIDEIELMGGENSPFNINVDGLSGQRFESIELNGGDSLFIFVEVTLSVNNDNLPLVVEDSIRFRTNGKDQYVKLIVWGQDAYFHVNEIVSDSEPWSNDKPHVVFGVAAVGAPGLDSNLTLTIPAGTDIYFYKSAYLWVYKSSLFVQGQLDNEVEFRHIRHETYYEDKAGQWRGVVLTKAKYSQINYAVIRNAEFGIQVDTTSDAITLDIKNTIVQNSAYYNLLLQAGPVVHAENSVFGDAGIMSAFLFAGGEAKFKHCNFVNYWRGFRGGPAVGIKNWYEFSGQAIIRPQTNTTFDNCVLYGNVENEIIIDSIAQSIVPFDVTFSNCLMRAEEPYQSSNFLNVIWNQNPQFMDQNIFDFHFSTNSPLNNAGNAGTGVLVDIEGNARNLSAPDIGAYEN